MNVIKVYFDGGYNGCLYGSWDLELIRSDGVRFRKRSHREQFDSQTNPGTSNVAEYESLISALKWLQKVKDKNNYRVEIWGDSKLVVEQVRKCWRCNKPYLAVRRDRVRYFLLGFKGWSINWHPRIKSVSRFGH